MGGWTDVGRDTVSIKAWRVPNRVVESWIPDRWKPLVLRDEKLFINELEFLAIIGLVAEQAHKWAGKFVMVWSDNAAATSWANGKAKPREPWRQLSRWLIEMQATYGFKLHVEWVSTHSNTPADTVSRVDDEFVWIGGSATRVGPNHKLRHIVQNLFR